MVSLPTEINPAQERLLHNILDEGISEIRGNNPKSVLNSDVLSQLSINKKSSALIKVINDVKNGGNKYDNMKNEISFLQEKIKSLENNIEFSLKSPFKDIKENIPIRQIKQSKQPSTEFKTKVSKSRLEWYKNRSIKTNKKKKPSTIHSSKVKLNTMTPLSTSLNQWPSKIRNVEDKYETLRKKWEQDRKLLTKERQKNYELKEKLEKYEYEHDIKNNIYEEYKKLKDDYNQLKVSLEKSEKVRRHQSQIIKELTEHKGKYNI